MIQRIIIYIEIFDRLFLNYVSFDLKRKKGKERITRKHTIQKIIIRTEI